MITGGISGWEQCTIYRYIVHAVMYPRWLGGGMVGETNEAAFIIIHSCLGIFRMHKVLQYQGRSHVVTHLFLQWPTYVYEEVIHRVIACWKPHHEPAIESRHRTALIHLQSDIFLCRALQTFGYTSHVPMRAAPRNTVPRKFYRVIALVSDITCFPALRASIDSGLFISNCKRIWELKTSKWWM